MIKRIARWKIYIDRARWYLVLSQFFMILIIFINSTGLKVSWWHYPFIILGTLFTFIVVGYFDRRMGIIKEEQRFYSTENPVIQEILKEVRRNK